MNNLAQTPQQPQTAAHSVPFQVRERLAEPMYLGAIAGAISSALPALQGILGTAAPCPIT